MGSGLGPIVWSEDAGSDQSADVSVCAGAVLDRGRGAQGSRGSAGSGPVRAGATPAPAYQHIGSAAAELLLDFPRRGVFPDRSSGEDGRDRKPDSTGGGVSGDDSSGCGAGVAGSAGREVAGVA